MLGLITNIWTIGVGGMSHAVLIKLRPKFDSWMVYLLMKADMLTRIAQLDKITRNLHSLILYSVEYGESYRVTERNQGSLVDVSCFGTLKEAATFYNDKAVELELTTPYYPESK